MRQNIDPGDCVRLPHGPAFDSNTRNRRPQLGLAAQIEVGIEAGHYRNLGSQRASGGAAETFRRGPDGPGPCKQTVISQWSKAGVTSWIKARRCPHSSKGYKRIA